MRFRNVRMIAAVGNSGEIGYGGRLPWHSPEDLREFKLATMGGICIVGRKTAESLPPLPGREVVVWQRHMHQIEFALAHSERQIWICGGAFIYKLWRNLAWQTIITHVDYDGPADAHMPLLWRAPPFIKSRNVLEP